jgi:rhamnopyranosyl-N-acetylglucosaminyl-diphospho-decaprenol beta-1,3/1,4-galactofuranosyltransferase
MSEACVIGLVATHRRPQEIARLLASLARSKRPLRGVIVVDNAGDFVPTTTIHTHCLVPGRNLGCGGGLALAEKEAFARYGDSLTHLWILDDDAVVEPDTLDLLLAAMSDGEADLAHPLTVDARGRLGWFPGLLDRDKFAVAKQTPPPEEFVARCGSEPVPFSWSQGIALLITRRAMEAVGWHRTDYLVRGEDLEFSLRLTARFTGLYVPKARVHHLPPGDVGQPSQTDEYFKHRAMLQNVAYTALHLSHGHRIARTIPGNWWRFLRMWGWRPHVILDACLTFFRGALLGKPAGAGMQ